jgi:hypothetical protein
MNLFRAIYTGLIILFVFVGNIGINIYTHSCEEDGEYHTFLIKGQHSCEEEEDKSVCCEEESKTSDCCKDEVNFFKVNFDYFDNSSVQIPSSVLFLSTKFEHSILVAFQESGFQRIFPTQPPPKPSGREILLLNQVFRI